MQVKIDVFENFFQKRRFNNEIYTRLTCLKDIFCYQLANHYAQFDNKTRSLTTVLQGLPTSCQLELANCNLPLSLNSQSCLSRVPEIPALYNEPTISQLEVLFMKINYKKLGKRIQSARRETGLSQEQLAEAIGKSPSAVSTIETGKRGASLETLVHIANVLQVSADYLLADQLPHIPWEASRRALLFFHNCEEWELSLLQEVELRKRTHQGKPIQEATVQKYLTVVSAVLSDAKQNEIIGKNPARMIDLPETKRRQQFIPTDQQAQDLILALLDETYHYKLFYVLAMYTGCCRGELCALRWNDFVIVEKYRSVLTVSRSRTVVAGQGVVEGPTKNGRSRTIALSEDITSLVQGFFYYQREIAEQHGRKLSPYLFVNEKGNPIHPDTFTKHLRQIFEENDFPDTFHLHTLRHYFVSTMLHEGVDKQTVAELAGHGDTSFLERTYCHPQMALKEQAEEKMNAVLLYSA